MFQRTIHREEHRAPWEEQKLIAKNEEPSAQGNRRATSLPVLHVNYTQLVSDSPSFNTDHMGAISTEAQKGFSLRQEIVMEQPHESAEPRMAWGGQPRLWWERLRRGGIREK